ncbi:CPA1 family monovalent cation:H+ antiporter [Phenylobacterium haematophilum]|uniref:CPA1 family monovalent cation:H+ antiporter n=1 Tax=Phenylobacterium haematophilum TaxID=98513 RepID=A0A839ZZE3_9CAUL|nr:Na+/H+ antiporter [Phenylobacterium haematophilum]MBB3891518.1 CPA1 family monovalent cation:H+ antiporter [Phenylobacterium haematophilum]
MSSITTVLVLLLAVVVSAPLARLVRMPLPLVQIGLGAIIALSFIPTVDLKPSIFFLLFLPPLLFLDGWRIPKDDLFRDGAVILELALGLVVFTVVGVGFLIHWLIPAMPLAVAFALAAILSPTDPIAVSAIASRAPIPKRLMHILEGESLLNDASGLVCMRFAVAAAVTGAFSLREAVGSFLWVAFGGLAIGVGVTWTVTKLKNWIIDKLGEDTSVQILVSLLIPFGAYLLAEHFHCSGILAAVAAGVTMSFTEQTGRALAVTRVRRAAVWDTVQFALNGVIFVLLGEQMPSIMARAAETVRVTGHHEPWWLIVYVLAITAALAVLRFVWAWFSLKWNIARAMRRGQPPPPVSWRLIAATSVAGVRGAITLAGVLTLPFALADGTPFPARNLAIFLAAGVIIVSLVLASIVLPRLLKNLELPPEPSHQNEIDNARVEAAQAAITAIEQAQHGMAEGRADADLYIDASGRIMELYRQRIDSRRQEPEALEINRRMDLIERQLRLAGLRAERDAIFKLARARRLDDESARKLVREIDLLEARYG